MISPESIRNDINKLSEAPIELTNNPEMDYRPLGKKIRESDVLMWKSRVWLTEWIVDTPDEVRAYNQVFETDEDIHEPFFVAQLHGGAKHMQGLKESDVKVYYRDIVANPDDYKFLKIQEIK